MAAPCGKEDSQKWLSHEEPQGCADSELRYRYCDAKRKCGKLVAALRHRVNLPMPIVSEFDLHSREKGGQPKMAVPLFT
jgi:hypothetical protein